MNTLTKIILIISAIIIMYLFLYISGFISSIISEYWIDKINAFLWLTVTVLFVIEIIHLDDIEQKSNVAQRNID